MTFDEKGFTLVEILAVLAIMGIILVIMVPTVNGIIQQNKQDNYDKLENNIIIAAKEYLSDYRYEISIDGICENDSQEKNIKSINNISITDSKIMIKNLINKGYFNKNTANIKNPLDNSKVLNTTQSYIIVKYSCKTKDYIYPSSKKENRRNDLDIKLTWN